MMTGKGSEVITTQVVRQDGTSAFIEINPQVVIEGGKLVGNRGLVRDITDRKRAEEALKESEQKFKILAETAPVGIFRTDRHGQTLYVNPRWCEISKLTFEQTLSEGWLSAVHPDDRAALAAGWAKAVTDRTGSQVDYRFLRADGSIAWVVGQSVPQFDSSGEIVGYIGTITDITDRKQRERELVAIAEVIAVLRTARTRAEMLPVILDQLLALLNADSAALTMRDPTTGETVVQLARGELAKGLRARMAPGEGMSGAVIASGKPFVTNNIRKEPGIAQPDAFENVRAAACVPLVVQDQVIGTLWIGRQNEISAGEIRLLTSIADIAANAIHRQTLHEQTIQQLERLAALYTIDNAISGSMDLRVTLNILLDQVVTQLGVDAAGILLFNPHTLMLEYSAGKGFRSHAIEKSQLRLGEGYAGRAALERRTFSVPDLRPVGSELARAKLLAGEEFVAYFGVPLITKGKVIGVLEIFHRSPLAPAADWLGFLQALAGQAAIAIDNAELFSALQRSNTDLSVAYDATIEGWSHALDLRDKETEGHTLRVTEITLRLACAMGLSDSELVQVRRGALLHDIGKMGVPDSILLKPDKLTDEEWVKIRQHPVFAYEMLAPIAYLRQALDIPYCHHEKWDGSGYPRGLKGDQIPLTARIFAVVDVWDALTTDRPYRPAWTKERTREHILAGSGKHFDPQVVEQFIRIYNQLAKTP